MLETLETRVLFSSIDTSSVALFDASGNPASINRHMAVWFVVHGANMSKDLMTDMATAVQAQLPANQWQVLIVDWSSLASTGNVSRNAQAVGDKVASLVHAAKLPASRVNVIGFSLGGTVIGKIAADLKSKTTEVNRLIAVDARAGRYEPPAFAENSAYSIAFGGRDSLGGETGSLAADDAVLLTGLSPIDLQRHVGVFSVVTTIWQRDAGMISRGNDGVSSLSSIQSILNGPMPTWRKNAFLSGYEAEMSCGNQSGLPNNLGPLSLTYLNNRGRTRIAT